MGGTQYGGRTSAGCWKHFSLQGVAVSKLSGNPVQEAFILMFSPGYKIQFALSWGWLLFTLAVGQARTCSTLSAVTFATDFVPFWSLLLLAELSHRLL